jgi:hypothetical protein
MVKNNVRTGLKAFFYRCLYKQKGHEQKDTIAMVTIKFSNMEVRKEPRDFVVGPAENNFQEATV